MAARKPWTTESTHDGVAVIHLKSWTGFYQFIHEEMLDYRTYVYRGQRGADWKLESGIDRLVKLTGNRSRDQHLANFKRAVLGRRGPNPPKLAEENDWWALGQHYGLATPLLDWTTSPFVAAYFAFAEESPPEDPVRRRAVWAVGESAVALKSAELKPTVGSDTTKLVEFVRPQSDENARLLNQGGLFTRLPDGVDLQTWVASNFAGAKGWILFKITMPDQDRSICLRDLNRMNINHLSLFPDLYGASKYCNMDFRIPEY